MSQAGSYLDGTALPNVETLTGNIGGAVGPTGGNINVLGGSHITTTGNPGTSTLTIDLDGDIADTYTTDAGNANPAAGILNVLGGENINTAGAGSTVTINLDRGTNGQLLIAATGAPTAYANLTSLDGSLVITNGANSIDLSAMSMGGILTLTGDLGGAVSPDGGGDLDILGGTGISTTGNPGANSITIDLDGTIATSYQTDSGIATPAGNILNVLGGDNMNTAGAGMNLTVHLNETIHWPNTNAAGTTGVIFLGGAGGVGGTRFMHNYGTNNTFLGQAAGNLTLTSVENTGIGREALDALTTGRSNTAVGYRALSSETVGDANTAIGNSALINLVSVSDQFANNVAIGHRAGAIVTTGYVNTIIGAHAATNQGGGAGLTTGYANIIIGSGDVNGTIQYRNAGWNYTAAENQNILIGSQGVTGETQTIRIGGGGTDEADQTRCFIRGIYGVNPTGTTERVAIVESTGQIGTLTQTNGQVIIGSTGATPVPATLTAGTGISITNGAGSITIDATGGGLTWSVETGASVAMAVNRGYIANRAAATCVMTLPDTAAVGSIIRVTGINNATGWRIAQNAGETIYFGASATTTGVGGYLESTATRDSVELVCVVANTDWNVISSIGNPTVA